MIKSYIVDSTYNNMRLDRWLRNKIRKNTSKFNRKKFKIRKN